MRDLPNANEINLALHTLEKSFTPRGSTRQALKDACEELDKEKKLAIAKSLFQITKMLCKQYEEAKA